MKSGSRAAAHSSRFANQLLLNRAVDRAAFCELLSRHQCQPVPQVRFTFDLAQFPRGNHETRMHRLLRQRFIPASEHQREPEQPPPNKSRITPEMRPRLRALFRLSTGGFSVSRWRVLFAAGAFTIERATGSWIGNGETAGRIIDS